MSDSTEPPNTPTEASSLALQAKAHGNELYLKGEYQAAVKSYTIALQAAGATVQGDWVETALAQPHAHHGLLAQSTLVIPAPDIAACYSNRAACHLALRNYVAAEFDCSVDRKSVV